MATLRHALSEIRLGHHADKIVDEFGFDIDQMADLDEKKLRDICVEAQMKWGEKERFLKRFLKKEAIVVRLVNAGYPRQLARRAMEELNIPAIEYTPEQESQAALFIEQALEQASPTSSTAPIIQPSRRCSRSSSSSRRRRRPVSSTAAPK